MKINQKNGFIAQWNPLFRFPSFNPFISLCVPDDTFQNRSWPPSRYRIDPQLFHTCLLQKQRISATTLTTLGGAGEGFGKLSQETREKIKNENTWCHIREKILSYHFFKVYEVSTATAKLTKHRNSRLSTASSRPEHAKDDSTPLPPPLMLTNML